MLHSARFSKTQADSAEYKFGLVQEDRVKKYNEDEQRRALSFGQDYLKRAIPGFEGLNGVDQKKLYDSTAAQEFANFQAFKRYYNSPYERERQMANDIARKHLSFEISPDRKYIITKDNQKIELTEENLAKIEDGTKKNLTDEASAIKLMSNSNDNIAGFTINNQITRLLKASNFPENPNRNSYATSRNTVIKIINSANSIDRRDFLLSCSAMDFLEDGVIQEHEKQRLGLQLDAFVKHYGLTYDIDNQGKFNIIQGDGTKVDAKKFFSEMLEGNSIYRSINDTIKTFDEAKNKAAEENKLTSKVNQYYQEANIVNDLRGLNVSDKEKENVRKAYTESMLLYEELQKTRPDDVDNNILTAQRFFQERTGNKYKSAFDTDAYEIEMERAQRNLSSWDDEVIKQTGVASRSKSPSDLERAAYGTMGRAIPNNQEKEHKELSRLVGKRDKAREEYEKQKSRYENAKKRSFKSYRVKNQKSK